MCKNKKCISSLKKETGKIKKCHALPIAKVEVAKFLTNKRKVHNAKD